MVRAKRKEEQSHILKYQKDIRDREKHYRSMELDILERMEKDDNLKFVDWKLVWHIILKYIWWKMWLVRNDEIFNNK